MNRKQFLATIGTGLVAPKITEAKPKDDFASGTFLIAGWSKKYPNTLVIYTGDKSYYDKIKHLFPVCENGHTYLTPWECLKHNHYCQFDDRIVLDFQKVFWQRLETKEITRTSYLLIVRHGKHTKVVGLKDNLSDFTPEDIQEALMYL